MSSFDYYVLLYVIFEKCNLTQQKTLLDNVTQLASTLQKLYLATAASLSRSCRIQDHLKSFDLEQSYKVLGLSRPSNADSNISSIS